MMNRLIQVAVLLTLLSSSLHAHAAFCALRDPVGTLETLFPDATSHRSIVKVVSEAHRKAVSDRLPPNVLHFSELGQHTLYVTYQGEQPLGYVHVRSEQSEWGLVEIAWALDLDLNVVDFHFQRCRSRDRRALEADDFKAQLRGKDFYAMKDLLASDQLSIDQTKIAVPDGAEDLASVLLRCGLKTLLVTEMVWREDLAQIDQRVRLLASFQSANTKSLAVHPGKLEERLSHVFPDDSALMSPERGRVLGVYNKGGELLGSVYRNKADLGDGESVLEWHISPDSRILAVNRLAGWPDARTRRAFSSTVGQQFDAKRECSDRPGLMTKQAVLTAQLALDRVGS